MRYTVLLAMWGLWVHLGPGYAEEKPRLNDEGIYLNPNITVNKEGRYEYSSKDRGQIINGKYYQDEFREPDIFDLDKSMFTEAEHRGSHIPKEKLVEIEAYLGQLADRCPELFDFDNAFNPQTRIGSRKIIEKSLKSEKDASWTEVQKIENDFIYKTACEPEIKMTCEFSAIKAAKIEGYFPTLLAERIQRCNPYRVARFSFNPYTLFSTDKNPLQFEYLNRKESYYLLKQYELLYLTIRANQLLGRYTQLMVPSSLLREFAEESGFAHYLNEYFSTKEISNDRIRFPEKEWTELVTSYFGTETKWQNQLAAFLDRKTKELSILEFDYIKEPLDLVKLDNEFYQLYPKRYKPLSRKTFSSWSQTHLQDEMKSLFGPSGSYIISTDNRINLINKGIYDQKLLTYYDFTFDERLGKHITPDEYNIALRQIKSLVLQCDQRELNGDFPIYYYKIMLTLCLSEIPHYKIFMENVAPYYKNIDLNRFNYEYENVVTFRENNAETVSVDRSWLKHHHSIEIDLYPKIYLLIRHYRLFSQFTNLPIPTKFMDEYLDQKKANIDREDYGGIIYYLYQNQDDFAEYLDRQYQTIEHYLID